MPDYARQVGEQSNLQPTTISLDMPLFSKKLANIRLFHQEISAPQKDGSTSNAPFAPGFGTHHQMKFPLRPLLRRIWTSSSGRHALGVV
ncbi:MAG: hypothetical protein ABSH50_20125 [Bryobacteraceae bacterium]